jgi:hypothetical protein
VEIAVAIEATVCEVMRMLERGWIYEVVVAAAVVEE